MDFNLQSGRHVAWKLGESRTYLFRGICIDSHNLPLILGLNSLYICTGVGGEKASLPEHCGNCNIMPKHFKFFYWKWRNNGELPLKNDDFVLRNVDLFFNSKVLDAVLKAGGSLTNDISQEFWKQNKVLGLSDCNTLLSCRDRCRCEEVRSGAGVLHRIRYSIPEGIPTVRTSRQWQDKLLPSAGRWAFAGYMHAEPVRLDSWWQHTSELAQGCAPEGNHPNRGEFCITNHESFITWAVLNHDFAFKHDEFCIKNAEFCIKHAESCTKHDEICIKNAEFCI